MILGIGQSAMLFTAVVTLVLPLFSNTAAEAPHCIDPLPAVHHRATAAIVVATATRQLYLSKTLSRLLQVHQHDPSNAWRFPLYVSQDGNNSAVTELLAEYAGQVQSVRHQQTSQLSLRAVSSHMQGYYRIADHYKFILTTFFDCLHYPRLIILEDDLEVAVDFFTYFERMAAQLDNDPSLYVVSSWNDHGQKHRVSDPYRLYRSDHFPGLGWMLRRSLWDEFKDKWPAAYFDDWMQEPAQRKGRHSIYPEVCRTYNIGEDGTSGQDTYNKFLRHIRLNNVSVDWSQQDLSYLQASRYRKDLEAALAAAQEVYSVKELEHMGRSEATSVKLRYSTVDEWSRLAGALGLHQEFKAGRPRTSYNGVVTVKLVKRELELYIYPASSLQKRMQQFRGSEHNDPLLGVVLVDDTHHAADVQYEAYNEHQSGQYAGMVESYVGI